MLAWVLHPPTLQVHGSGVSKVPPIISKAMNIQHHLLGISREGRTFMDRALTLCSRSAPKIFSAVAHKMA